MIFNLRIAKSKLLLPLLILLTLPIKQSFAQGDFEGLKSDILNAATEQEKLEGIVALGITLSRNEPDSLYFYADSLSSSSFQDKKFAEAGKLFLEAVGTYHNGDIQLAVDQLEVATARLKENASNMLYLRALNFLGIGYQRLRDYKKAIDIFDIIIESDGEEPENTFAKVGAYGNQSNAYRSLGNYAKAIINLEKLLKISKSIESDQSMTYLSLGQMLNRLRLHERAIDAFRKFDLENFPVDPPKISLYTNLGDSYTELEMYDSALYSYNQAYDMATKPRNWRQRMSPEMKIAGIFLKINELDSAYNRINSAYSTSKQNRYPPPGIGNLLRIKLDIEIAKDELDAAQKTASEFEEHMERFNIAVMGRDGYRSIAQMHEKLGNTEEALKFQKIANSLEVSVIEDNAMVMQKAQLELLEKEEQIVEESANTSFYKSIGLNAILTAAALLTISIILFLFYRKSKKENSTKEQAIDSMLEEQQKQDALAEKEFITLKSKALIKLEEIKYIRSDGPYLEFFLSKKEKPEVDRNTLKSILEELPNTSFLQIHRSFIVNLNHVKSLFSNKIVLNDGTELNVSRSFKERVEATLKKKS
ncbi:LytTR family transcriptional regulator DNA-binding domain-containing protein [Roseivirga sp.]|uniref:LytTR family transcriptional regulator DNA-binding domain-containing protein n=1 Tax=Roseivirga sp. TaxID=1964215 RepID=UPI003B8B21A0